MSLGRGSRGSRGGKGSGGNRGAAGAAGAGEANVGCPYDEKGSAVRQPSHKLE